MYAANKAKNLDDKITKLFQKTPSTSQFVPISCNYFRRLEVTIGKQQQLEQELFTGTDSTVHHTV